MLVTTILSLLAATLSIGVFSMFFSKKWDPRGKHCYVTGGSTGLGLSLAIILTKLGADVSIVARDEKKLKAALDELEKARQTPNQVLKSYSHSLTTLAASTQALDEACAQHGDRAPDAMFLCAGASRPYFFVEETEETLQQGMDAGYWVQAYSALAGTKRYVREQSKGKIVFVSSLVGYMSFVGYASYAPAKHALRGLAETLRSEFILYGISVHIFFPGTIFTPGYETENKTKPKITLKIEETDGGMTPDKCAAALLRGVQKGQFHIANDILGDIIRSSTRGATRQENVVLDSIYGFIGWLALPVVRWIADSQVSHHRQEHQEYLKAKGLLGARGQEEVVQS